MTTVFDNPTYIGDDEGGMITSETVADPIPDPVPIIPSETIPLKTPQRQQIGETSFEETSFSTPTGLSQKERFLIGKINSLFEHVDVEEVNPNLGLDRFQYEKDPRTHKLVLKFKKNNGKWTNLTNKETGEWLADSSLKKNLGGERGMIEIFGQIPERFKLLKEAAKTPERQAAKNQHKMKNISTAREMESIPLHDDEHDDEHEIDEIDEHEIDILRLGIRTIQDELTAIDNKIDELDRHITHENEKLQDSENDPELSKEDKEFNKKNIKERLNRIKEEKDIQLELASQNKKALQSQFARIRQTVLKVLDSDTTLAEKIRTIFREQGLTITAVLTAFGLLISTIVEALTGGSASGAPHNESPPKDKKGIQNWIKKQLKHIANLLGKLGQQLGAALPGILASIVSWLFSLLSKTAGWVAEHVWILLVAIAVAVYTYFFKN